MANRNFPSQFSYSFEKQMVHLAGAFTQVSAGANASLVNQGITYSAAAYGEAGNAVSIELIDQGDVTAPLDITVTGSAISVELETTASVAADLVDQGITYEAITPGAAGDNITIELLDPSANDSPLSISVVGTDISVSLATDSGGLITTDADELVAALNLDAPASALISASGSGSSPLNALVQTNLSGGADAAVVTDADALVAALQGDVSASALVSVSGTGSSPLVALAETNLSGGSAGVFSNNLPVGSPMSLSQIEEGVYQLQLSDKYISLLSASISLMTPSPEECFIQLASEDVSGAGTITFRAMESDASLIDIQDGDKLYIDLNLRNVR